MEVKNGYYIFISKGNNTGVGECSYIEGLSIDNLKEYEKGMARFDYIIANDHGVTGESPTFSATISDQTLHLLLTDGHYQLLKTFDAPLPNGLLPAATTEGAPHPKRYYLFKNSHAP